MSAYPGSWGAEVRVHTANGEMLVADRNGARGDPALALTDDEMIDKANMLLGYAGCDDAEAGRVVDNVLGLTSSQDAGESIAFINQRIC